MFMYTHRPHSALFGSYMPEELDDCLKLHKYLSPNLKDKLLFRYPDHGNEEGWFNSKNRVINSLGKESISQCSKMLDTFKESKILICKYPQTTFAEAMFSRIPTILSYNENCWDFNENFDLLVQNLKQNKIIINDVRELASHINFYWNNLDEWWMSKKTKQAKENFFEVCCKYNKNWLNEWSDFFKRQ